MSGLLDGLGHLVFVAQASRVGRWAPAALLLVAVGLIALAKPEDFIDTRIYDVRAETSMIPLVNKYARVRGQLIPAQAIESEAALGQSTLKGSRYVPLIVDGRADPLFVLDRDLPAVPQSGGPVELVGRIEAAGGFPNLYLAQGDPPNIPLENQLARLGVLLAALTVGWWLLGWWLARMDFALPLSGAASARAPGGLRWYGALGSANMNMRVRAAPVTVVRTQHETRLEPVAGERGWAVHLRQLRQVSRTLVAGPEGACPAARMTFTDERDQTRSGTLVGPAEEIDALLFQLSARAQKPAAVQTFEKSRSL